MFEDDDEWKQWFTQHQVFVVNLPSNSSHITDALDARVFGYLQGKMVKIISLLSDMMGSPFEMSLDLKNLNIYPTSTGLSFIERSSGFEPVLNPRTQVMMVEHIFATRLEQSKIIALQGLQLVGQVPFDPSVVLNKYAIFLKISYYQYLQV